MSTLQIKTHQTGRTYSKPHFFILNKGLNYGKYAALTALGTYMVLNPQKAQAQSPEEPGTGF